MPEKNPELSSARAIPADKRAKNKAMILIIVNEAGKVVFLGNFMGFRLLGSLGYVFRAHECSRTAMGSQRQLHPLRL